MAPFRLTPVLVELHGVAVRIARRHRGFFRCRLRVFPASRTHRDQGYIACAVSGFIQDVLLLIAAQSREQNSHGRLDMLRSTSVLVAMMTLLATGFVLYPQGPANAAKFCAQLRGAKAAGQPDCSFSSMETCRLRVRHRGGGHCFKLTQ